MSAFALPRKSRSALLGSRRKKLFQGSSPFLELKIFRVGILVVEKTQAVGCEPMQKVSSLFVAWPVNDGM